MKLILKAFGAILEFRFQELPGRHKVKRKEYTLRSKLIDKDVDTSMTFNRCFLPGQRYEMSIVFSTPHAQSSCPACHVDTGEASDALVKW